MQKSRKNAHLNFTIGTNEFCDYNIAPEKFVKELIVKPTFRELHKRYCEIKANPMTFDLQTIDIEHEYPILGRAYRQLGVKELKRLRTIKSIQEALGEA